VVPRQRAQSLGAVAAAYAAHCPGYPDAAVDWALTPLPANGGPRRLLDPGAGTGKLTAALLGRGEVIAVEPDSAMLAQLRRRFPAVGDRIPPTLTMLPVATQSQVLRALRR
jgi:SAM-dependent methyltransferase